jgi:hypothetical protein
MRTSRRRRSFAITRGCAPNAISGATIFTSGDVLRTSQFAPQSPVRSRTSCSTAAASISKSTRRREVVALEVPRRRNREAAFVRHLSRRAAEGRAREARCGPPAARRRGRSRLSSSSPEAGPGRSRELRGRLPVLVRCAATRMLRLCDSICVTPCRYFVLPPVYDRALSVCAMLKTPVLYPPRTPWLHSER